MSEKRIRGVTVDIDYRATKRFFDKRGTYDYASPLSMTMYQDKEPDLVFERDRLEKHAIGDLLTTHNIQSVFDVGCGIGRWGWFWEQHDPTIEYQGIDFSDTLISKAVSYAEENGFTKLYFQTMSATDVDVDKLQIPPPYDCIIVSGLLIYLNDVDCINVLTMLKKLMKTGGHLYIREPISLDDRLTLNEFYSNELDDNYSAIYRNLDEMKRLFEQAFDGELSLSHDGFLFPDMLEKRQQTKQYFFILSKQ